MARRTEPLVIALSVLLVLIVSSSLYYLAVFQRPYTTDAMTEALYYSVQTVTIVGYGNWLPRGVAEDDARVLSIKRVSIPLMLGGASIFAVIIGIVTNMISQQPATPGSPGNR